jgi:hypothetical protein
METLDIYEQLAECATPSGYYGKWSGLVASATRETRTELLEALTGKPKSIQRTIIAACCEGPDGKPTRGYGGNLRPEAEQYVSFVLAVAETAVLTQRAKHGQGLKITHLVKAIGRTHKWVEEVSESHSRDLANAALVSFATLYTGWAGVDEFGSKEIEYLADNYAALEPYLAHIVQSGEFTLPRLEGLLADKPVLPLLDGML